MKRIFLTFLFLMLIASNGLCADTKVSGLTADTSPGTDSLIYTVDDPGGTPASRKSTVGEVLGAGTDLDANGVIAANAVGLGTDTAGDFVATITAGNGMDSTGATTGEAIAHTLSLDLMTATNGVGTTNSASGLEFISGEVSILQGCNDEQIISWEEDDDSWHCASASAGSMPSKEYWWPASALLPLEAADSIPPINKIEGTNLDALSVDYNSSTDECRTAHLKAPSNTDGSGTVTFTANWTTVTGTASNVVWDARHNSGVAEGASFDQALTTEAAAADAGGGSANVITSTVWTETIANLGWADSDDVMIAVCRDANNGSDTLNEDARLLGFSVIIPRD